MPEVEVPFTSQEVDTSNPSEGLSTVVMLIAGFALFSMASGIGNYVADKANSALGGVIGVNPATGESNEGVPGV
jgi:hypothetical protein